MENENIKVFTLTNKQNEALKKAKDWWLNDTSQKPFVILGCAGCLDKNSRILTNKGYLTLEEIFKYHNVSMKKIGETKIKTDLKVFNGEKYTDISSLHVTSKMPGYKITLNSGTEIISSFMHKFKSIINGKLTWVESKDLKENDYIASLGNKIISDNLELDLDYYYMGYYHADGYFNKNKKAFSFDSKNKEKLKNLKETFNIKSKIIYFDKKDIYKLSFSSKKLEYLFKCVGLDVKNKIIPINLLSDKNKRFSYLKGLFNDIGISNKGIITFSSLHKINSIYVMEMCKEFGIIFNNLKEKRNQYGKTYQITLLKDSIINFYNIFGNIQGKKNKVFLEDFINQKLNTNLNIIPNASNLYNFHSNREINNKLHQSNYKNKRRNPSYKQLEKLNNEYYKNKNEDLNEILKNKYYFDKIVKIEEVYQTFYDITVPDGHCYIANGLVSHNSGKSTLISYLIKEMNINSNEVQYCTLTGKAASILQRKGNPASTIHSLIYEVIEDKNHKITFKKKETLPEDIKLIVVDEFMMINKEIMDDLMSFKRKMILIGDPYQLPPPFGERNGFDKNYDVLLDEPLRQSLDSPIIYLANQAKNKERIKYGTYGNCKVIRNNQIKLSELKESDQIIAGKNITVKKLNQFYRNNILNINSIYPKKGEKLICLKNNRAILCSEDKITVNIINGLSCILESHIEPMRTIKAAKVDVRPDFFENHCFKNIYLDLLFFENNWNAYNSLYDNKKDFENILKTRNSFLFDTTNETAINPFTFGYVCTCYKFQGSEAPNIYFFQEYMGKETYAQHLYTGITRASEKLILVL